MQNFIDKGRLLSIYHKVVRNHLHSYLRQFSRRRHITRAPVFMCGQKHPLTINLLEATTAGGEGKVPAILTLCLPASAENKCTNPD